MRSDSASFAARNEAASKEPQYVIAHMFDVESVYCTSHPGISGVPGIVIENVVRDPSAISQRIVPDEGRSEIGSFGYSLLDSNGAFTNVAHEKLADSISFRGKQVRLYVGYKGMAFSAFKLFQTQIVKDISFEDGEYQVTCADITREQRDEIFEPKKTTLRDSVDADDSVIPVYTTAGFQTVFHGPTYSDAPNATVGYIKLEDEWIRYTGKTADTFTGCTRGVMNTKAVPHVVDAGTPADRRPKIEEVIYLELPGPKLAYAINTGVLHGDAATLPDHWHCGIDPSLVRLSDFTGIGRDLWDTGLETNSFVMRFAGLSKINAKKFLEAEVYQLLGCYSPVYSDGTIGLRKMNPVLAGAAYCVELNETNVVSAGQLRHNFTRMHNRLLINWNWNGKEFTRSTLFVDGESVDTHGAAPLKKLSFKGLHGSRHTEAVIRQRLDAFRDRYSAPPLTITVSVMPSLDRLEVGDVVRLRLAKVHDFAGNEVSIDRSFEIQRKSQTHANGDVDLELFGSSAPASIEAPNDTGNGNALPDAFYTAAGTDLATVVTIVNVGGVGVIQPGTYDLTGHADMNNAAAVFYYNGDLELANGATLRINQNVQLRVRGFFTINGVIDGVGRGKSGQADVGGWNVLQSGLPGFIGNSRGMDGVVVYPRSWLVDSSVKTQPCAFTQGQHATFPHVELRVSGNSLLGIPSDLRGTSGGAGGKVGRASSGSFESGTVTGNGGAGANSGAGLAIVCRGCAPGASATINLSGANAAPTSPIANPWGHGGEAYPGAGGAGGPGALLLALDGSSLTLPDLGGKFVAACGTVPINGSPLPARGPEYLLDMMEQGWLSRPPGSTEGAGYVDEAIVSGVDLSNVAFRIQYIPAAETPSEDEDPRPPAPIGMTAIGGERINTVRITPGGPLAPTDVIELYSSIDNNRANAVRIGWGRVTEFTHDLPQGGTRWYWARVRREVNGPDIFSEWFPAGATSGVDARAFDFAAELPGRSGVFLDTFEHQDYARFYDLINGSPNVTYPTNGETGGRVLRVEDFGWLVWKENIPYDPAALYVMTVRARMVTAPTNAQDFFYAGVAGVAADGETLINISGANSHASQHYFAASGFDFGGVTLGQWTTFRGYLRGHSASPTPFPAPDITNPLEAFTGVRFIRPLVIVNYDGGDGIMEVDYIRLDRVVDTPGIAPGAAQEVFVHTTTGPIVVNNTNSNFDSVSFNASVPGSVRVWLDADANCTAAGPAYARVSVYQNGVFMGGVPSGQVISTTGEHHVSLSCTVPVTGGTIQVRVHQFVKSPFSATIEYTNIAKQVGFVKR